jgi:UDP-N-acetylglucosamine 1-carboxyvinyltransferase
LDRLQIEGPCRLSGEVEIAGAKNAALPALAASLLTESPLELSRVPAVRDIGTMRRLLEHLGIESRAAGDRLQLDPSGRPRDDDAPYELVKTMRASVLVLGPLVARRGHARVSLPGGCAIGVRPIDQHLAGLEALGAEVTLEHGYVSAYCDRLRGASYRFSVPTVTGTENLMMAACLARGTTLLENCAREPEIRDLAALLTAMGARISGAGEETIEIEGVEALAGARHAVLPDRIEAGTYLLAGAITGGDLVVTGAVPADLAPLLEKLAECGCDLASAEQGVRLRRTGPLNPRDIVTAPHPGFPTDLQAQYLALMTQAEGSSTICETIFENRFQHVSELRRMGTDLRASACLVLAGLVAEGTTLVDRIYHLDRGYEVMELKLQQLGGRVQRISKAGPA